MCRMILGENRRTLCCESSHASGRHWAARNFSPGLGAGTPHRRAAVTAEYHTLLWKCPSVTPIRTTRTAKSDRRRDWGLGRLNPFHPGMPRVMR